MVQAKARYTNVPVQTDVGRSQQMRGAKKRKHPETTNTQKNQTNPPKQKPSHANKPNQNHKGGGAKNTNQDIGQRGRQARPTTARARGEEGKRRPANKKERTPGKVAEAGGRMQHKPRWARTAFSGVLRGLWITRGRIPQRRSEGHTNNTHSMVERAKPHTGPKPLLP